MEQKLYWEYESNENRDKTLSLEHHLHKIRPYLKDIINDLRTSDTLKDNDEERDMHSKSDNIEIMMNDKADEVIEELF